MDFKLNVVAPKAEEFHTALGISEERKDLLIKNILDTAEIGSESKEGHSKAEVLALATDHCENINEVAFVALCLGEMENNPFASLMEGTEEEVA